MKSHCLSLCLIFVLTLGLSQSPKAQEPWFPVTVNSAVNPHNIDGQVRRVEYTALNQADKKWKLCVSFPHLKDDYWLAVNYGVVQEAKRLGVELELFEAGGYNNLINQISQIQQCVAKGAQAIIIASIDADGLNPLITSLTQQNIPVIDLVNGMTSRKTSARSLVSFYQMGYFTGQYLNGIQSQNQVNYKVAWFPGPRGAAWVEAGNRGLKEAIRGRNIEIVSTQFGDVGRKEQGNLVKEALKRNPDVDFIVGTSATVLAAMPIVRRLKPENRPQLISYYMTRGVYNAIVRKQVLAAPTDQAVLQGRISVDQAVRILQKQDFHVHAGPIIRVLDQKNILEMDPNTILAPNGFIAELSVK